jgi:membrane-associated phospholipid phosphatase
MATLGEGMGCPVLRSTGLVVERRSGSMAEQPTSASAANSKKKRFPIERRVLGSHGPSGEQKKPRHRRSLARSSPFRLSIRESCMPLPKAKSKAAPIVVAILLAVAAALLVVTAFRLDDRSRAGIVAMQGKGWKKSSQARVQGAVSRYGDWPWLMAAGGVGLFFAWRVRNREWQRILITAMVASTVAGALVNTVRLTSGRTRPRESPKIEQSWVGPFHEGKLTIGNSKYNSFPSGHTATAMGFAGVFLFARPLLGIVGVLLALGIAWSRMLLGAHHLSDVTVATLFALLVAWICWRLAVRRGDDIAAWVARKIRRQP